MMESIIALDIGSTAVKAVYLRRGWGGLEWVGAARREWPRSVAAPDPFDGFAPNAGTEAGTPAEAARRMQEAAMVQTLRSLISDGGGAPGRVIVSVPLHLCSVRTAGFPFSEGKRLQKVIPFEIESQMPFDLSDVVMDHQVMTADRDRSEVWVAAMPRETLRRHLSFLSAAGIDPSAVDLDALALYTLGRYGLKLSETEEVAMIEIGATKTTVVTVGALGMRSARAFLHGSLHWTEAIAAAGGLSLEEAERRKRQIGLGDGTVQSLSVVLETWAYELMRTLHAAEVESRRPVTGLVLCGGGAQLKGLEGFAAKFLGRAVKKLEIPLLRDRGLAWEDSWSVALGLALKAGGVRPASQVNFRKDEFAFRPEVAQNRSRLRWAGIGFLALMFLGAADLTLKYRIQDSRYQSAKGELRALFREMFPEVRTVVDEILQAETLVAELKKKGDALGLEEPSALEIISELTSRVPKEIEIEVRDLAIEPGRIRIDAQTQSFESADRIKDALAQSPLFKEVKVNDLKIGAGQKVVFQLTLGLAPRKGGGA